MVRLRSNFSTTTPNRAGRRRSQSECRTRKCSGPSQGPLQEPPQGPSQGVQEGPSHEHVKELQNRKPFSGSGKRGTRQRSLSYSDDTTNKNGEMEKVAEMDRMKTLFECPVCFTLPICDIYQCKRGHLLCEDCHGKLTKPITCPSCRVPMVGTPIRSRAAEHVSLLMSP